MKKNLLSRLGKTLIWVKGCRCCYKSWCCHFGALRYPASHHCHPEFPPRHPEFISGSQEGEEMLNPVQHDGRNDSHPASHHCHPASHHCHPEFPPRHPEFISGSQEGEEMLNPVQHDGYSIGQASNPTQYDGWCRASLSLGRSMIEMLGVLAIIGVLSIGGLYAYRQAMERYKINETIHFLSQFRLAAMQVCSVERCALKLSPDSQSYLANAMLLCNTMGNPSGFCNVNHSNGWTQLKFLNDNAAWISYKIKHSTNLSVYMQIRSISREQCIAFANPRLIDAVYTDLNTVVYPENGAFTEAQFQAIDNYCTNTVAPRKGNLVIIWKMN